jgi:hypothetical protein
MKTVISAVLAMIALTGCVAVPYPAGPGVYVAPPPAAVYVAPPPPAVYYRGHVHRHHYHRHHYHH